MAYRKIIQLAELPEPRLTALQYQLDQNSTLPCTISSVQVFGAPNTRRSFLQNVLNPLLSENKNRPYTLSEALREVSATADKLGRFGW